MSQPPTIAKGMTLALVLALALAAACGGAPSEGAARGVVTAVDAQARTITLDHDEIPGMMKAMTMTFDVAPEVSLAGVEPGADVEFRLTYEAGAYTVVELRPAGS